MMSAARVIAIGCLSGFVAGALGAVLVGTIMTSNESGGGGRPELTVQRLVVTDRSGVARVIADGASGSVTLYGPAEKGQIAVEIASNGNGGYLLLSSLMDRARTYFGWGRVGASIGLWQRNGDGKTIVTLGADDHGGGRLTVWEDGAAKGASFPK